MGVRGVFGAALACAGVAVPLAVAPPATATAAVSVDVGRNPYGIAVDPGTHTAYVINKGNGQAEHGNGSLSVINGSVVTTMPVGGTPVSVAVDPNTHTVYVAVYNSTSSVLVISPTGKRRIVVTMPIAAAVDTTNGTVWVLQANRQLVSVVGRTQTAYTVNGSLPNLLALDSTRHVPYVLSPDGTLTSVSQGRAFVKRLSGGAAAITVDEVTGEVFVAHSSYFGGGIAHPALLSELSGFQLHLVDLGFASIGGLAVDPTTGTAAVSEYAIGNTGFGELLTVDGTRVRVHQVGGEPGSVAVDASDGVICAVDRADATASIVQGTAVQTVPTGQLPIAAAIDDTAHLCYVAGFTDGTVTEIPLP